MKHSLEKWGRAPIILWGHAHSLFWGLDEHSFLRGLDEHSFFKRAQALIVQRQTSKEQLQSGHERISS